MFQERLSTCSNLTKRGIIMISEFCPLCNDTFESENHVFLSCQITSPLLIDFCNWWGASISGPTSLHALHSWGSSLGLKGNKLTGFRTAVYALCWCIWKFRNSKVFQRPYHCSLDIIGESESLAFFWLNSRGKLGRKLNWVNWISSHLDAIPV